MFTSIRKLFRVTAVRLSVIYIVVFALLSVGIVVYMTGGTINVLRQQYESSIDREVLSLGRIYRNAGVNALLRTLERRARAPGANLYVITDPSGRIIAGNVPKLQNGVLNKIGWIERPFKYERYDEREGEHHLAIARVLEIPNGMRVLVGRDIGEHEGFRRIVRRAFTIALGSIVLLGFLTWFFVGRRALKRIDQVSKSSQRIMSGDRSERLPVTGVRDEFDRLSESLNKMLDRISSLDIGLKQMSDNIAHDLKTPITRLRNKAESALTFEKDGQDQQAAIVEIIADCDDIVKTFDALLMISRVESGSSVASFKPVEIASILRDVHELYEPVAEDDKVSFDLDIRGPENRTINGNRELLSQAISNLIDNALKYGAGQSTQSRINLQLEQLGNEIVISVSDNGQGVLRKDHERVLERFTRLESSRSKSGNGLGLSLVNAIVKMHSGRLELSDNNPGLCVKFILPVDVSSSDGK